MPQHLPCPECGAQPRVRRGITAATKHLYFAECMNNFDCDLWPITRGHAAGEEALASWQAGEAFPEPSDT